MSAEMPANISAPTPLGFLVVLGQDLGILFRQIVGLVAHNGVLLLYPGKLASSLVQLGVQREGTEAGARPLPARYRHVSVLQVLLPCSSIPSMAALRAKWVVTKGKPSL